MPTGQNEIWAPEGQRPHRSQTERKRKASAFGRTHWNQHDEIRTAIEEVVWGTEPRVTSGGGCMISNSHKWPTRGGFL